MAVTRFRRDRSPLGGGVACAARTLLRPVRRQDLETDAEVLVVQLGNNCTTFLVVCYRLPDRDRDITQLIECLGKVCSNDKPVIPCGDFNFPEIEWPGDGDPTFSTRTIHAVESLDGVHDITG